MIIREMSNLDWKTVDCLMQRLHRIHLDARPDLYIPIEHPYSEEKFMELVEDEDVISSVAEKDSQVIGICFVEIRHRSMMVSMKTAYMMMFLWMSCIEDRELQKHCSQRLRKCQGKWGLSGWI